MSTNESSIELREIRHDASETTNEQVAVALHPVDRGFHAWLFVVAASGLELIVWGFPQCYGIFQDWYLTHEFKNASEAAVNAVGTITLSLQYAEGILVVLLARRYARYLRHAMWVCLGISALAIFLSSFATQIWQLIMLQGIIYGAAGGVIYSPYIIWIPEWFSERRSLATSLIFAGMPLGGAIFPIMMNYLLEHVGFRWTLRIWSGFLLVFGGLCILGIKPRLPVAPTSQIGPIAPMDISFMKAPMFVIMAVSITLQGLGMFCVSLYIPSYATTLGFSRLDGTIALSAYNLASVVGQILFGMWCEKRPFTGVIFFSGLATSILAYALWGFAHNLTTVFIFTIGFASIAGGFTSTWMQAATAIAASRPASDVMLSFAAVKAIPAVVGPLIAAALHPKKSAGTTLTAGPGGWGGYGFTGITVFVGSAMAATALMGIVSEIARQRLIINRAPAH
ncbi:MFS general substrate transporter [Clavulina sp. PMI_390]|nr:MFS general substrate transporter [Clavulina sp. PMI_390]